MDLDIELLKRHRTGQNAKLQMCEWQGCCEEGLHRAPKSRQELNSYRWFCMLHARAYNKSWNYYDGMSDSEVEADVRQDTVWQRPTWRLGTNDPANLESAVNFESIHDPFDILNNARPGRSSKSPQEVAYNSEQKRALSIFDLDSPGTVETIKQRYKELVKRYHPDVIGKNAKSDEKIKDVNQAYRILMDFVSA